MIGDFLQLVHSININGKFKISEKTRGKKDISHNEDDSTSTIDYL